MGNIDTKNNHNTNHAPIDNNVNIDATNDYRERPGRRKALRKKWLGGCQLSWGHMIMGKGTLQTEYD